MIVPSCPTPIPVSPKLMRPSPKMGGRGLLCGPKISSHTWAPMRLMAKVAIRLRVRKFCRSWSGRKAIAPTIRPATVMRKEAEIGALRVGSLADVALFRLADGVFPFYDVFMNRLDGKQLLINQLTICGGREMSRIADGAVAPWIELSEQQRNLVKWGHTPESMV